MSRHHIDNDSVSDFNWLLIFNGSLEGWRVFERNGPTFVISKEDGEVKVKLQHDIETRASFMYNVS